MERAGGGGLLAFPSVALSIRGVFLIVRNFVSPFASLLWRSDQRGVRARLLRGGYGGRGRSPFRTLVAWRTSELRQQSADRRTQRRSRSGGRRAAVCWRLPVALTGRAANGWILRGNLLRCTQHPKSSVLVVPTSDVVNRRHG